MIAPMKHHTARLALAAAALSATPALGVTVVAPTAAWPAHVFSPYVDLSMYPTPQVDVMSAASGTNFYTLAFLTAGRSNNQQAGWGGYDAAYPVAGSATDSFGSSVINGINAVRAKGGDVMASFGGAAGTPIDSTITTPAALVAEYQRAIDAYKLTAIDFDVEGSWAGDAASIARRSAAIATLERNNPALKVWFTLETTTAGLPATARNVVDSALGAGARVDGVNVMAMDYYDGTSGAHMGDAAVAAANATHAQLNTLFTAHGQTYTDAQLWGMQGVTPMIGLNDDTTENFTPADAQQVLTFAQSKGLGYLAFWNATRDHAGAGVTETSSGTNQTDYQYAKLLSAYNTTTVASTNTWSAVSGSWGTAANWGGVVPAAGAAVTFPGPNAAAATVTLDGNRTVGRITFSSTPAYTIAPGTGGTLTFTDSSGSPGVTVTFGSHTIAAPVSLANGVTITTAAGTGLTLAGAVTGSGQLTVAGAGTTTLATTATVAVPYVSVTGTLALAANNASAPLVRTVPSLSIGAGGLVTLATGTGRTLLVPSSVSMSVSGRLDLGGNDLLSPNGGLAVVNAWAATGYAGGTWAGPGLDTSAAAANRLLAVGVIPNTVNGTTPLYATFDGRPAAATDVLARVTYYGDANLDGVVNATDYTRLDAGTVTHATGWINGDFNYDGVIDGSDYALADNAFNRQTAAAAATPAGVVAAVPEPTGLAVVVTAAALVAGRRRRATRYPTGCQTRRNVMG